MARGRRTDAETEAAFRAEYMRTGNILRAAEATGIPERTGWDLAARANKDPDFTNARREMYARALPDYEAMLRDVAETVHGRILEPDRTPEELADIAVKAGLKSFSYSNPKPAYIQALVAQFKALQGARRLDAEKSGEIPTDGVEVTIRRVRPADEQEAD